MLEVVKLSRQDATRPVLGSIYISQLGRSEPYLAPLLILLISLPKIVEFGPTDGGIDFYLFSIVESCMGCH